MIRRVAAVFAFLVVASGWLLAQDSPLPGPAGGFSGGTVPNAVVLTGDNAGGVGTLRIRPSDEDTQIVLCEASNNSSPEMCSSISHYNGSTTVAGSYLSANGYVDSSGVQQRYNTGFGIGQLNFSSSSTAANNFAVFNVYGTGGAVAGNAGLAVSGAATSTFITGTLGTVTNDFRGPILNGGSATCNGNWAGSVCFNEGIVVDYASGAAGFVGFAAQNTSATGYQGFVAQDNSGTVTGFFASYNATYADADYADDVAMSGLSKELSFIRTDNPAAGAIHSKWTDDAAASATLAGVTLMTLDGAGRVAPLLYGSQSNCSDGAGAAACTAAPAGSVVIDDGATTVVVSTTAVTANSQITPVFDSSLGTKLGVTCNTTYTAPYISARTAATSFTITAPDPAGANPACFSYTIIN